MPERGSASWLKDHDAEAEYAERVLGEAFTVKMRFHHPVQGLYVASITSDFPCKSTYKKTLKPAGGYFDPQVLSASVYDLPCFISAMMHFH
jgi:hypothetical protein